MAPSKENGGEDPHNSWYHKDVEQRLKNIENASIKRNDDKKTSLESGKKYDKLKRAFYNITESAYLEGTISETEKEMYCSKVRKIDRKSLHELKTMEKENEKNYWRRYNTRKYKD